MVGLASRMPLKQLLDSAPLSNFFRTLPEQGYPSEWNFTFADAERLIRKKLTGLIVARSGVSESHSFYDAILHVLAQNERQSRFIYHAFRKVKKSLDGMSQVTVMTTIAPSAEWLFY